MNEGNCCAISLLNEGMREREGRGEGGQRKGEKGKREGGGRGGKKGRERGLISVQNPERACASLSRVAS